MSTRLGTQAYRAVLALPDVRRVLVVSLLLRVPMWAGNVILTLHIVTHLHRSYGAAGLADGIATLAAAISSPWRGRLLDRVGLRRTVAPSLLVLAVCWGIAPFVGYELLVPLAAVAGLFTVPSFSIVRQALLHVVQDEHRKSALSIDSVMVEISFMIGPALGVVLATYWATPWAMFSVQYAAIAAAAMLWAYNPPIGRTDDEGQQHRIGIRSWLSPQVGVVLFVCVVATIVLTGTDVGVVAALRHMGHQAWIGWELAVWGAGSAIGGLVYGAMHATVPVPVLVGLLAVTTVPIAFVRDPFLLAALLLLAGLFCAPTITATIDVLSRIVPARVRGEVLGWHGSALTVGSAIGAPIAGVAIDSVGWPGAFLLTGLIGVGAALVSLGLLGRHSRHSRHGQPADADVPLATTIERT